VNGKMPWTLRAAAWVGTSIGRWQRRRAARRDDDYVQRWKDAWIVGRDSRWAGVRQEDNPYRRPAQRQAWLAGWEWAGTQPDRRDPSRPDRRAQSRHRHSRRAHDAASDAEDAVA